MLDMRLGMICRMDNSGLGNLSWEFARNLKPNKILLVQNGVFTTFPERYKDFDTKIVKKDSPISQEDVGWITDDIDVVVSCETFYNWDVVTEARRKGVKTALVTMFEMTPERLPRNPDLFLCPSLLDYDVMPEPKVYLPCPIADDRLPWKLREKAKTFVHIASHGGMNMRKGTRHIIDAMKEVKSDIKMIIYSWSEIPTDDPRIEVKTLNFKNYWQLWREGDVVIHPQDYNGICLPIQEAFASGLGVLTTDIYPFNTFLPKQLLFTHDGLYKTRAARNLVEVDAAKINASKIAEKIDEIANQDISELSKLGQKYAKENSWEVLAPKYLEVLEKLCQS